MHDLHGREQALGLRHRVIGGMAVHEHDLVDPFGDRAENVREIARLILGGKNNAYARHSPEPPTDRVVRG